MELIRSFFRKPTRLSQLPQPLTAEALLGLFDVFYVCFDEPNRQSNWQQIKTLLPKAQKVEGVVGFDRALKVCARKSKTHYFFLIDGDNRLRAERFSRPIEIADIEDQWVLSWSSYNPVNGLAYGNGGLKLWPKEVALNIRSHENATSDDDQTDYCFIADYYLVDDYVSETVMNTTYRQAFRAGFREGVKMSLAWGKQVDLNYQNFEQSLGRQNRERLKIWCEIGDDSLNGGWGILGARLGLLKNVVEKFDYSLINSYEWIDQYLHEEILPRLGVSPAQIEALEWDKGAFKKYLAELGEKINRVLPLQLADLTPIESLNFKRDFQNPSRSGLLGRSPRL